ncbi:MAG: hypothetical protein AAF355_11170 [Myxococcota bacterium]
MPSATVIAKGFENNMLKRLFFGALKGFFLGGLLAVGVVFGLRWSAPSMLLNYLLSMGFGATAGVLLGTTPWRQKNWIESVLKSVGGVLFGALIYWTSCTFLSVTVPFDLPGIPAATEWTRTPILYGPWVTALFGSIVELDNTMESDSSSKAHTSIDQVQGRFVHSGEEQIEEAILVSESKSKKNLRRS